MNGSDFQYFIGGVKKSYDREGRERYEVQNKHAFKQIAQKLRVLARSTPEDKFALIVGLQD